MAYLDLAEMAALRKQCRLFSCNRWGPAGFLEQDHLQTEAVNLEVELRHWLQQQTGEQFTGPIRLLTLLRSWGYYFSPLSLYYLFNPEETMLEAIVAEVSNTPWRESHRYLLRPDGGSSGTSVRCVHPKEFHVSPFMDMNVLYRWYCTIPADFLTVQIQSEHSEQPFFTAQLSLTRREFTDREIVRSLWRSPWATGRVVANIYWQALVLWWKRCPFFPHPNKHVT